MEFFLPHVETIFMLLFSFLQCCTNSLLQQRNDKISQRDKNVQLNTDVVSVAYTQLGIFISMLQGQMGVFHIPAVRLCALGLYTDIDHYT